MRRVKRAQVKHLIVTAALAILVTGAVGTAEAQRIGAIPRAVHSPRVVAQPAPTALTHRAVTHNTPATPTYRSSATAAAVSHRNVKPQTNGLMTQSAHVGASSGKGTTLAPDVFVPVHVDIFRDPHLFQGPLGREMAPAWSGGSEIDPSKIPGYDGPDRERGGGHISRGNGTWGGPGRNTYTSEHSIVTLGDPSVSTGEGSWGGEGRNTHTRGGASVTLGGDDVIVVDGQNDDNGGKKDTGGTSSNSGTSGSSGTSDKKDTKDTGKEKPTIEKTEKDPNPEGGDPNELRSPVSEQAGIADAMRAATAMGYMGGSTTWSPTPAGRSTGDSRPGYKKLRDYSHPDPESGGPDEFRNPVSLTAAAVNLRTGETSLSGESGGGGNGPIGPDPGWSQSAVQSGTVAASASGIRSLGTSAAMSPAVGDNGTDTGGPVDPRFLGDAGGRQPDKRAGTIPFQ